MRVSLNLYRQQNFASSRIIRKEDLKSDNVNAEAKMIRIPDTEPAALIHRSVILPEYAIWRPPFDVEKVIDYDANLEQLNSYIAGIDPHEEFNPSPLTLETLKANPQDALNRIIFTAKSPKELVQYYTDYCYSLTKKNGEKNTGLESLMFLLDVKIDFEALGINPDELSISDKVKFLALYDYWAASMDGAPRNGYKKPAFIKSPAEFLEDYTLDGLGYSYFDTEITKAFKRVSPEEKKRVMAEVRAIAAEYKAHKAERKKENPPLFRPMPPIRPLTIPERTEAAAHMRAARILANAAAARQSEASTEYDPNLDMAKAWHEFLGGEWD